MGKFLFVFNILLVSFSAANPLTRRGQYRIVGGNETSIEKSPWMVSVQYMFVHVCGGSIIGEQWVLSAVHCVNYDLDVNQFIIHAGSSSSEDDGSLIEIKNIVLHPKYDAVSNNFDFALLKLDETLKFTRKIQPIALPNANTVFKDDTWCKTVGWGDTENPNESSENLRGLIVLIFNQNRCNKLYAGIVTDQMICVSFSKGGTGTCLSDGDSGSSLFTKYNGVNVLIGVTSWGHGCVKPIFPGVFGRVTSVRSWIKSVSGI